MGAATRGAAKTKARAMVVASYGLTPPAEIVDRAARLEWTAKKVKRLLKNFKFLFAPYMAVGISLCTCSQI